MSFLATMLLSSLLAFGFTSALQHQEQSQTTTEKQEKETETNVSN